MSFKTILTVTAPGHGDADFRLGAALCEDADDEIGFRLGEESFVTGEHVPIRHDGTMHTYQVALVEKP